MSFKWAREAELCLRSVGSAAGMLGDETGRRIPLCEKESARDVVTGNDIAIEKHLREVLSESPFPIIGEEIACDINAQSTDNCWWIDPIDGTANYINNIPFYCTSIGFMTGSDFVVGAVISPALRELYFVSDCGEAYLNGLRLKATNDDLKNSLIGMAFSGKAVDPSCRAMEFELFGILNDKSRGCLRTGSSALNICYVASGKMQVAVGFNNRIWDVAGALAIAQTAGCKLFSHVHWPSNRISYVIGSDATAEAIASEINSSMSIGLKSVANRTNCV